MTPDTLSTLTHTFARLDDLLPDARSFMLDATGIIFSYGRSVGCWGEYETEWQTITLSWAEFLDEGHDYIDLNTLCKTRWQTERDKGRVAREAAETERRAAEARQLAEEKRLAPQRRRERELAELARLKALYET